MAALSYKKNEKIPPTFGDELRCARTCFKDPELTYFFIFLIYLINRLMNSKTRTLLLLLGLLPFRDGPKIPICCRQNTGLRNHQSLSGASIKIKEFRRYFY